MIRNRYAQRPSKSAAGSRAIGVLLIAVAFILQITLAERHFEPLVSGSPVKMLAAVQSLASGGDSSPLAGPSDDDCPLCQFLALGIATDVPHLSIDWLRAAPHSAPPAPADHAPPRELARGTHQARAPPSPTIA